jgi:serine/threonine protein kinase/tetratricopeptide (TPR) repeat protein
MLEQRATKPFQSNRFETICRLGSGGMGVVYEARDRVNGNIVAIKTLSDFEPDALLRFKTEFRALQNVHHPNLVQLYELIEENGVWFFTMELVEGIAFDAYTRPEGNEPAAPAPEHDLTTDRDPTTDRDTLTERLFMPGDVTHHRKKIVSAFPRGGPTYDEPRLRRSLAQLADALSALHTAGKIHCDVKPSNVLVNDERAVLIDFGILLDVRQVGAGRSKIVGTPAFMAPEQAAMRKVGPAADWYAVGTMLYLALTGRVPFAGEVEDVLEMKQRFEPPPPDTLVKGLPHDLVRLCIELLALDPASRPTGSDIVQRLHRGHVSDTRMSVAPSDHFLGRERELTQLDEAFSACERRGVAVILHGEAGIGKSSLATRFATKLTAEGRAWVLTGRCDQRETLPFKALDEVFDALSSEIGARFTGKAAHLLPERADLLAQTFPTLRRIPIFEHAIKLEKPADARRTRDLVFAAARDLTGRLAVSERLCIVIEDLHWADPDSMSLIIELMREPAPAGVLLVGTMRTTADTANRLEDLEAALGSGFRTIAVTPLAPDDAFSLAEHLAGGDAAQAIIEETGGHPLFIDTLARSSVAQGEAKQGTTLDSALWARARTMSPAALEVLTTLSLTPVAVSPAVIATATNMSLEASVYATTELRVERLVRLDDEGAEPYHDLVRRAVVAHIPREEYAARHAALAAALEQHHAGQPETLAIHLIESGQSDRALAPAIVAAEQATRALAFDRAARLHALVLELLPTEDPRRLDLCVAHGQALANAARGRDAARAFLAAAELSPKGSVELKRLAAELYLMSGHVDEGLATLETVLGSMGMKIPSTPFGALSSLLVRRAQIRLGGLDLSHLKETPSPRDAMRIDTCWSVAAGLGLVDTIRGADFQARHFQLALRYGDRYRAARALATEACYASTAGPRAGGRAAKLLDLAGELALQIGDPRAIGVVTGARGITAMQLGRWREGRDQCENAEAILRESCQGISWELDTSRLFRLLAMVFMGEIGRIVEVMPAALREAEERGDLNGVIGLRTGQTSMVWLARDDPDEGDRQLDDALRRWSRRGYQLPHYQAWFSRVQVLLYRGRGREAFALVEEEWKPLKRSLFLSVHLVRTLVHNLAGRAALAAARADRGHDRKRYLSLAAKAIKVLEREGAPWSAALAKSLSAQWLVASGRNDEARESFFAAKNALEAVDMHLDAAVARRAHGLLVGGQAGEAEVREAESWMTRERISRVDAMSAMLAPFGRPE